MSQDARVFEKRLAAGKRVQIGSAYSYSVYANERLSLAQSGLGLLPRFEASRFGQRDT